MSIFMYIRVCVCVCVCARARARIHYTRILHTYMYYISYIYVTLVMSIHLIT
jgi:hypothetical protein